MKKQLLIAAAVATIGIGSLGAVGMASAATSTNTGSSSGSSLIDRLVTKFGLNKADVQAVFDEEHAARDAEQLTNLQTKLASAVTGGKLTQAQSDTIVAKYKELQAARQANLGTMSSQTDEERMAARDAERTAFDAWVTNSGIPTEYAQWARGGHHGGHGGFDGHKAPSDSTSSSSSSTSTTN